MNLESELNIYYQPAEKNYWEGRKSNPDIGNQYWHQEIELVHINNLQKDDNIDIALIGYVCDEGVRRNRGRIGASEGARSIRGRLAKLPIHFGVKRVIDVGDVVCLNDDMEACQELLAVSISKLIGNNIFPIALGGGHDMAYGNFKGIYNAIKNTSKNKIGIINFDAHFDLRPVESRSNSGTPFYQIISEFKEEDVKIEYFAIGIQQQSNTKELFNIAEREGVDYAINYDCESSNTEMKELQKRLKYIIDNNDYLYISIDMDDFSSAYAPGVSAPSPLGFTPYFMFKMLSFLMDTDKVISMDIAELNPSLDNDMHTATLAAKIVDFVVMEHKSIKG